MIVVLTSPFAAYRDIGFTVLTIPKTAVLACALGLIANRGFRMRPNRAALLLLAGALAIAAATAMSIAQAQWREAAIRETLKALQYALTFWVVYAATRSAGARIPVRIAISAVAVLVAIGALGDLAAGARSVFELDGATVPRVAGPIEGPNQLAGFLGVVIPFQAAFVLSRTALPGERFALALSVVALLLSFSRAGVVTVAISLIAVMLMMPQERRRAVAGALLLGIAGGAAIAELISLRTTGGSGIFARFISLGGEPNPGGVGERAGLWNAAVTLWRRHPYLGIGAGNFELELSDAGLPGVRTHANSLYLQSLVEGGLPLLLAWLYAFGAALRSFAGRPWGEPLVAGAFGAALGLGLHVTVDLLIFYPKVGVMFWAALALGAAGRDESALE